MKTLLRIALLVLIAPALFVAFKINGCIIRHEINNVLRGTAEPPLATEK